MEMQAHQNATMIKPMGSEQLTPNEADLIALFFARLASVYPDWSLLMPDGITVRNLKREHAGYIIEFSIEQIDKGLHAIHLLRQDFHPHFLRCDLDKVIGVIRNNGKIPSRFDDTSTDWAD